MKTPVYHPNKEMLFNNQFTFKNYVNTLAIQNGSSLIIGDIHNVRAGKGLSKNKVYIDIYLKGQWGVTLTVDMSLYKLLNEKTIGKYSAQQTKEMIGEAISFFYNFILEGFAELDGTNERKRQKEKEEKEKRDYIDSLQSEIYFDFLYNENDVLKLDPEQYYNDFITKHNVTDEEIKGILFHYIKRKYKRAMKDKTDQQTTIEIATQETGTQDTQQTNDNKEVFHLYNNTFNTYQEAYNYAIENDIKLNMILSSKHPFMTNERLQELENIYTFSRHTFTLEDAQEYYNYLNTIPETSDSYERICKLKSIINRLESRQRRLQEKEAEDRRKAQAIDKMLNDLYSIGMTKKEWSTHVTYFLNDQPIYTWFTGITTDKMYNELLEVYNKYFKTSQAG
jgi:hypothetical protein